MKQSVLKPLKLSLIPICVLMILIATSCSKNDDAEELEISWSELTRHTWVKITSYNKVTLKFGTNNTYTVEKSGASSTTVEGTYAFTSDDYILYLQPDGKGNTQSYEVMTLDNHTLELMSDRNSDNSLLGEYYAK